MSRHLSLFWKTGDEVWLEENGFRVIAKCGSDKVNTNTNFRQRPTQLKNKVVSRGRYTTITDPRGQNVAFMEASLPGGLSPEHWPREEGFRSISFTNYGSIVDNLLTSFRKEAEH
jgi:hypothetical protein